MLKTFRLNQFFGLKKCLALLFLVTSVLGYAQLNLKAKANRTDVRVNERFVIDFFIEIPGNFKIESNERLELPKFKNLQIIGEGQIESQHYDSTKGAVVSKFGRKVYLVAEKEGTYTIDPASIIVNGKKYSTMPITISVQKNIAVAKNEGKRIHGAFLAAELKNSKPYVNEPTILSVKLFARDYTLLNRKKAFEAPKFTDFVAEKIEVPKDSYRQEVVNGKVFVSEELVRYILIPKQNNKTLKLDPFSIQVVLSNFFGSESVELTTSSIQVDPKPLPKGAPSSFTGAVGEFKFRTDLNKTKANHNQSLNLDLELIGEGNLNMVKIPEIKIPEDIEVYKPKKREAFKATNNGYKGKLVNEYVLVPQYGGDYNIKPIEFTYFSPKEKKYKTIKSEPLTLNITGPKPPATQTPNTVTVKPNSTTPKDSVKRINEPEITNTDVKLPESEKEVEVKEEEHSNNLYVWVGAGLGSLLLLTLILILEKRYNKKHKTVESRLSSREKRRELQQSIKGLSQFIETNNLAQFYTELEQILTGAAMYLTEIPPGSFTLEKGQKELLNKQRNELVSEWYNLTLETKKFQYSPLHIPENLLARQTEAEQIIDDLFKHHY